MWLAVTTSSINAGSAAGAGATDVCAKPGNAAAARADARKPRRPDSAKQPHEQLIMVAASPLFVSRPSCGNMSAERNALTEPVAGGIGHAAGQRHIGGHHGGNRPSVDTGIRDEAGCA